MEEFLIIKMLKNYINSIDIDIMNRGLAILHNNLNFQGDEKISEDEFRNASSVIILAYYISHARDVYDGVINLRKTILKSGRDGNCRIFFDNIIDNKIDQNEYSDYLLYYIYMKIIDLTFLKIKNVVNSIKVSKIRVYLDFDINNLPDYLIVTKNDVYYIYEID